MTTDEGGEAGAAEAEATAEPKSESKAASKKAKKTKKPKKGLAVLIVLAVGVVLASVGALSLYMFSSVGKTHSVAHEHLPAGCDVVVRVDFAKIQALPSFQAKVKPAIDELASATTTLENPDLADLRSFLIDARLDPSRDIEEIAFCASDPVGTPKFALVVGGVFSSDGVVDAAAKRNADSERLKIDGRPVVKSKSKGGSTVFFGQAEDGAIIFANDETLLTGALKKSDAHKDVYKLPLDREISLAITSGLMTKQAERIRQNPLAKAFVVVTGGTGSLGLATPGGAARLNTASPGDAADVERELSGLLALARLKATFLGGGGGKAGLMDALTGLKTSVEGSDVVLELPWNAQGVDDLMDAAASGLRRAKKKS